MAIRALSWLPSQSPSSLATVSMTQYVITPESGVRSVTGMNSHASRTAPRRRHRISDSAPKQDRSRSTTIG